MNMIEVTSWGPPEEETQIMRCTISDLLIDGVDLADDDQDNRVTGIHLEADFVTIDRVHFYQCSAYGIYFGGGDYRVISNCTFEECALNRPFRPDLLDYTTADDFEMRAAIGGTPVYDTITNCKFLYNDYDSILLNGATFVTITGCEFSDSALFGYSAAVHMLFCEGVSVSGCQGNVGGQFAVLEGECRYINVSGCNSSAGRSFEESGVYYTTMRVTNVDGDNPNRMISITGCVFTEGILLEGAGCCDVSVDGCSIDGELGFPTTSETKGQVWLKDGASRNKVTNNMLRHYGAPSSPSVVIEDASCECNWISMNDMEGAWDETGDAIEDNGTDTDTEPYNRIECAGGPGPSVPVLSGECPDCDTLELSWTDTGAGEAGYLVEINDGSGWVEDQNVAGLSVSYTGIEGSGGPYSFRVSMNPDGTPSNVVSVECNTCCAVV